MLASIGASVSELSLQKIFFFLYLANLCVVAQISRRDNYSNNLHAKCQKYSRLQGETHIWGKHFFVACVDRIYRILSSEIQNFVEVFEVYWQTSIFIVQIRNIKSIAKSKFLSKMLICANIFSTQLGWNFKLNRTRVCAIISVFPVFYTSKFLPANISIS